MSVRKMVGEELVNAVECAYLHANPANCGPRTTQGNRR